MLNNKKIKEKKQKRNSHIIGAICGIKKYLRFK